MPVPHDPAPALQDYAHPEKLVTTEWLAENLGAVGSGDLVVVESDEDVLLYETGHIPGAVKIDWHLDLNDPVSRDYVDAEEIGRASCRERVQGAWGRGARRRCSARD